MSPPSGGTGAANVTPGPGTSKLHLPITLGPAVRKQTPSDDFFARLKFAYGVLRGLNIQPNPINLGAIIGWTKAEGGHTNGNRWNYLNTRQGAASPQGFGSFNTEQEGIDATVKTLKNGYYGGIIHALKTAHSQSDVFTAIHSSVWGTHDAIPTVNVNKGIISAINPNDPFDPTSVPGDVAGAVGGVFDAIDSIPKFLKLITSQHFLLDAGKVILGAIALILGVRQIMQQYNIPTPSLPNLPKVPVE